MISDEEILNAFRRSQNEGYRMLIDAYGNYVYTIVTDHTRSRANDHDREECVADIFIETLKQCRANDYTIESLKGLVTVISKRRSTDLFRKLTAAKAGHDYLDELTEEPADSMTPEKEIISKSEKKELWEEVIRLGKPDSDILILQFFHRKTAAETGEILKMTTASVNKRSQRAREKLKKILTAKGAF